MYTGINKNKSTMGGKRNHEWIDQHAASTGDWRQHSVPKLKKILWWNAHENTTPKMYLKYRYKILQCILNTAHSWRAP